MCKKAEAGRETPFEKRASMASVNCSCTSGAWKEGTMVEYYGGGISWAAGSLTIVKEEPRVHSGSLEACSKPLTPIREVVTTSQEALPHADLNSL